MCCKAHKCTQHRELTNTHSPTARTSKPKAEWCLYYAHKDHYRLKSTVCDIVVCIVWCQLNVSGCLYPFPFFSSLSLSLSLSLTLSLSFTPSDTTCHIEHFECQYTNKSLVTFHHHRGVTKTIHCLKAHSPTNKPPSNNSTTPHHCFPGNTHPLPQGTGANSSWFKLIAK